MNHYKPFPNLLILFTLLALLFSSAAAARPAGAAYIFVTNQEDSGDGSLRNAIETAQPGDTIVFAPDLSGATIMLTSLRLYIDKDLVIDGSALPVPITISGGGNMHVFGIVGGTNTVILDSLRIIMGESTQGGGIRNSGTLTVRNCTISNNRAVRTAGEAATGGGIANHGVLHLINSTVSENETIHLAHNLNRLGGGIYNTGELTVMNSTLSGNTAFLGGGIYNGGIGTMTITNSTFSGNTGHGIYNQGTLNYANTIIAGSIGAKDCHNEGPLGFSNNNLVVKNEDCGIIKDELQADPLLGELDYHGGTTRLHALLPGSPAIDAGDGDYCPDTDQRGKARPMGAGCDIGAFEYYAYDANFWASPTIGPAPLAVFFENHSTGEVTGCTWNFGDNTTSSVCGNQVHTYQAVGVYDVSLTVTGVEGSDTLTRTGFITVVAAPLFSHAQYLPLVLK